MRQIQRALISLILFVSVFGGLFSGATQPQSESNRWERLSDDLFGEVSSRLQRLSLQPRDFLTPIFVPESAFKMDVKPWKNGLIPVEFDAAISKVEQSKFFAACAVWSAVANIQCLSQGVSGKALRVTKGNSGCWSTWGANQGAFGLRRQINLQAGCWGTRTLLHEIGHTLGLIHEHQRLDRDQYLRVIEENIDGVFLGFNRRINFETQAMGAHSGYDFLSIMHYDRTTFSKNGGDTLVPQPGFEKFGNVMGTIPEISESDKEQVRAIYGKPQS